MADVLDVSDGPQFDDDENDPLDGEYLEDDDDDEEDDDDDIIDFEPEDDDDEE